ncbi:polyhydroxyalkanoate depolymerase [Stappia sp. 22II-S9-Z10]|nr:polyhydroxyalkanoate depolymerase [Stappia sp. 22II-S9-Z10]
MYYHLYELNHAFLSPARALNDAVRLYYKNPLNPLTYTQFGRQVAAATDVFERVTRRYGKPSFGLTETTVNGVTVPVTEEVVWERPFCKLLRFNRAFPAGAAPQPNLVIVAPMSGHYATLLRGTVETMLPHFNVHITDWVDARMVPLSKGSFDFGDYVDYVADITRHFGGDCHIVAVCQPTVPVFVAMAVLEQNGDVTPKSVTMMGGPLDTRENPTEVNDYAAKHDLDWFRRNVVMSVPLPHPGFMRPVYPGFLQLTGFMTMNLDRHMAAHYDYFDHLVEGDGDSAEKHRDFYDEYLSVMDLTAEFYLETVDYVFLRQLLPKGEMMHKGEAVDPAAITKTPIFTVEGEKDDISGIGQTKAAHRMTPNLAAEMHQHYEQPSVGHYGVFNGSRFRKEIAPRIVEFAYRYDGGSASADTPISSAQVDAMVAEAAVDTPPASHGMRGWLPLTHVGAEAIAQTFGAASDRMELQPDLTHIPATVESAARMLHRPFTVTAGAAAETAEAMAAAVSASISSLSAVLGSAVDAGGQAAGITSGMSDSLAGALTKTAERLADSTYELGRVARMDLTIPTKIAVEAAAVAETEAEPAPDAIAEAPVGDAPEVEAAEAPVEAEAALADTALTTGEEIGAAATETAGAVIDDTAAVAGATTDAAADASVAAAEAVMQSAEAITDTAISVTEDTAEAAAVVTGAEADVAEDVTSDVSETVEEAAEALSEPADAAVDVASSAPAQAEFMLDRAAAESRESDVAPAEPVAEAAETAADETDAVAEETETFVEAAEPVAATETVAETTEPVAEEASASAADDSDAGNTSVEHSAEEAAPFAAAPADTVAAETDALPAETAADAQTAPAADVQTVEETAMEETATAKTPAPRKPRARRKPGTPRLSRSPRKPKA